MLEKARALLSSLGNFSLHNLLPALVIAAAGILLIQLVRRIVKKILTKSKMEKAAHGLILSVLTIALYIALGLAVASKLSIDVTGIVAMASVLTLAVSLSVQNLLTNVIGGFQLLSTDSFDAGDYVEIAGQSGTVQEISLTHTKLVTPDNKLISIPNSAVVEAQIVNYSVTGTRRVEIKVTASYDAPTESVLEALREAADVPTVLPDPAIFVALSNYGESAIEYVLRVWTKTDDYWDTHFNIQQRIRTAFAEKGIEMTYPHLNVHIEK